MFGYVHMICDSLEECRLILKDQLSGKISDSEALSKLQAELKREALRRAMWELGYFPPDAPPPVIAADH